MESDLILILVVVALFNIILFFKVWGMTNNVKRLMHFYMHENGIKLKIDNLKGESFIDKDGKEIEM
ncbi:MAG: hypothetical protein O3A49_04735 [Candidatus Marinimicrobia bacterium]|nr:hypothetical protein [Candidatus Neomarinimicrobiota bacterium]MDA1363914.1 hypothetical protein [Candidatus Neomarinimicrobiota bacterium]